MAAWEPAKLEMAAEAAQDSAWKHLQEQAEERLNAVRRQIIAKIKAAEQAEERHLAQTAPSTLSATAEEFSFTGFALRCGDTRSWFF